MAVLKSWKSGIGFLVTLCLVGVVYFGYFYCTGSNFLLSGNHSPLFKSNYEAYIAGRYLQNKFQHNDLSRNYSIDLDNRDVFVFLHIQKTGGTVFGKQLVENLKVDPPCYCYMRMKKHCDCLNKKNEVWLFSRYSTGWRCGLHADWTELTSCVTDWFDQTYGKKKRNYHYITVLRDPVWRFVSEWMHVRRGATWKAASLKCNGREATLQEVPFCYDSEDWMGVTLQQFMNCPYNLAFNRQTRMLADLTTVHCYNSSALTPQQRSELLLASAKHNLCRLSYFGLVEFQRFSQLLFEHTLHMEFVNDFEQHNMTHSSQTNLTEQELRRIAELNKLDIELYQFAKDLFLQRVQHMYVEKGLPIPLHLEDLIGQEGAASQQNMEENNAGSQLLSQGQVLGQPAIHIAKEKVGDFVGNAFSRREMFGKKDSTQLHVQLLAGSSREDELNVNSNMDSESRDRGSDSQHRTKTSASEQRQQRHRLSRQVREKLLQSRCRP